jgi:hypothetical protein
MDLFDYAQEEAQQPQRLVDKYYMTSEAWSVYNLLKANILRGNDWVKPEAICSQCNVDERQLRDIIPLIIKKTYLKVIYSNYGYKIATDNDEFVKYNKAQVKRAISSLMRCLDLVPEAKSFWITIIKNHKKDVVLQGQQQIKFTGYETDIVRQFAMDYLTENEREELLNEDYEKEK